MSKIKIGILGASRGMDFSKRILGDYEYACLHAVCETYDILREKTEVLLRANGMDAKCYADYEEFLDSGIDAVIIANFANEHAEYAIRALEKGIHVYSEVQPVQTLDMALPGLLAFRSILDHGMPYVVPDLRNPQVREAYRNDHYATDPRTPAEYRLPTSKTGTPEVEEVYRAVQEEFARHNLKPGMN